MSFHRALQILCAGLILSTAIVLPQARQQPTTTFRVQSNLVVVDVIVRDKKGALVRDLRREEFKIFEDNVPQEIGTFSIENIPIAPSENIAENAPESAKPATVNFSATPPAERKPE